MVALKLTLSLALVLAVASPTLAHNFFPVPRGLVFETGDSLFRGRTTNKPWQRAYLEPTSTIKQSLSFNGAILVVVRSQDRDRLGYSADGLQLSLVDRATPGELTARVITPYLALFDERPPVSLYLSRGDLELSRIDPPVVSRPDELNRLIQFGDQLLLPKQVDNQVLIFQLSSTIWLPQTSFDCADSAVYSQPIIFIYCGNGAIYYPLTASDWTTMSFTSRQVQASPALIAGQDLANGALIHIWHNYRLETIEIVEPNPAGLDRIDAVGERVFLRFTDAGWFELLWESVPATLVSIGPGTGQIISSGDNQSVFFASSGNLVSLQPGFWEPIVTEGNFNHARRTDLGYLLWQTVGDTGGLTQFAPFGSYQFRKVNPWSSTTSPVQSLHPGAASYLSVITQSGQGNVNLYKTADFISWSRITLPTQPTYRLDIEAARALPIGSLVELEGGVSVPPGVVGQEIGYLQDATAGIQFFLSRSRGTLPQIWAKQAIVTGEISSSQAKRVVLESADDLEIGQNTVIARRRLLTTQAKQALGWTADLEGAVGALTADDLSLRQSNELLKVHFRLAKELFRLEDRLLVPVVIDWNSASGKVEAWSLSQDYQLLSRVNQAGQGTIASTETKTAKAATATKSSSASQSAAAVKRTAAAAPILTKAAQKTALPQSKSSPLAAPNIVLAFISLMTGALVVRGRRFQALIGPPS